MALLCLRNAAASRAAARKGREAKDTDMEQDTVQREEADTEQGEEAEGTDEGGGDGEEGTQGGGGDGHKAGGELSGEEEDELEAAAAAAAAVIQPEVIKALRFYLVWPPP